MIPSIGATFPSIGTSAVGSTFTPTGPAQAAAGADFGTVLSQIASEAVNTVKTAEATSIKGINGNATTQSVVESVMAAERTLQTAVSIRDKAVSAYLELSRMAI